MLKKLKNVMITWDGLWSIPLAAMLLMYVSGVLIELNPTADVIGIGLFQDVFIAAFRMLIANTFAQVGIAINAFLFFGFTVKELKQWFSSLTNYTKVWLVLGLYACYLLAFALMLP
jgi:hypothetical protein